MEAYQERVITEKRELDVRLAKLEAFIKESKVWRTLSMYEQTLLTHQAEHMSCYSGILAERIKRWDIVLAAEPNTAGQQP
jgi:hypothetical protein